MSRLLLLPILVVAATLAPIGASDTGVNWQALQRPFHLPRFASGARCPASKLAPQITGKKYGVGGAVGPGPVYPMLGRSSLLAFFRTGWGEWAGQKVLWFVLPDYKGPVLIRGRKLDDSQLMRFDDGPDPPAQIRLAPGETVTWKGQAPGSRGRPSNVRVRVPGCYGVQLDGTSFSTVVVFSVATGH